MNSSYPKTYVLDDFSIGLDLDSSTSSLDKRSLIDCKNFNLTPTKGLEKRNGMIKLYPSVAGTDFVHSLFEYNSPAMSRLILVGIGAKVRYYDTSWHDFQTGLADDKRISFIEHQDFCYAANGIDSNWKAYNTTITQVGIIPPIAKPTVADGGEGLLTGKYQYKYIYKRATPKLLFSNPSSISDAIPVTLRKIKVSVVASLDPQVTHIQLFRTYNLLGTGDPDILEFVIELSNTDQDYYDETPDADLGELIESDNDVPPKAKFLCVHKDYVFYAYCPDLTDGKSLVRWSKKGIGEAAPLINYQYCDRGDGFDITGIASLGDYLLIFKQNKIFVLEGEFTQIYRLSDKIGNIAPWAILTLEDKIIFLAEEGWKACDGHNIYDIAPKLKTLISTGYISINQAERYSVVYYPEKKHFQFLINHSTYVPKIYVGHFLVPLLFIDRGIPEETSENLVGWTYHQYEHHTLTCLGYYTDSNGILRIIAGSSNGYVYLLDVSNINKDDGETINCWLERGWDSLGVAESINKTIRRGFISYTVDAVGDITFSMGKDFLPHYFEQTLHGTDSAYCGYSYCGFTYCGMDGTLLEKICMKGRGSLFQFGMGNKIDQSLLLQKMVFQYRIEGIQ